MTRYECTKCRGDSTEYPCVQIVPGGTIYTRYKCISDGSNIAWFEEANYEGALR